MKRLSIISEPIKTLKNQALKFWATKEFAERKLAFSRTTWFLHAMYCFCIIITLYTFLIVAVDDMFILINFYDNSDFWLYNFIEEVYYNIPALVEVAILYFWFSPIIIRTTLKLSKAYSIKERAVIDWIEFKIKRRFPKYRTSSQRDRERLKNPKKKGKLNTKFDKFLEKRNDVERIVIRGCLWLAYFAFLGLIFFLLLGFVFDDLFIDESIDEVIEEAELIIEEARPERPTSLPPSTIFDIFIRSDSVIP